MADAKPEQEPSMEEILSSIRRIIAEDEGGPAATGPRAQPRDAGIGSEGVLDLTEMVVEPESPAAPRPEPQTAARIEGGPAAEAPGLVSAETAKATALALARLTRAQAGEERKPAPPGSGVTLEQFLGELLAPMLREWLDRNLPQIVERVVEQEVKKLARRAELL